MQDAPGDFAAAGDSISTAATTSRAFIRPSMDQVSELWKRIADLVREVDELPRSGTTVYGFVAGIHPTDHPTLPTDDGEG